MTPEMRSVFVMNAPTFLDEVHDPDALQMDLEALAGVELRVLATSGTDSAPLFGPVVDRIAAALPHVDRMAIDGADHVPHISVPDRYVELVRTFTAARRAS